MLETAGGVLSPGPSGTVQADVYRPLRLPVILVGDSKLGGIGTTISAFESLRIRGYDVDSVVLFDDQQWGNHGYLQQHFSQHGVRTFAIPRPPIKQGSVSDDESMMSDYYESAATLPEVGDLVELIQRNHFSRVSKLSSMPVLGDSIIWHPFRQHGLPQQTVAIDSAYEDYFQTYSSPAEANSPVQSTATLSSLSPLTSDRSSQTILKPLFDGSASWWTQGLGHGNPKLALTAAYAAGRYGHVMFAGAVHAPALDLSHTILSTLANPRLSRVFFTDNGSTGMEVAVKMALRASCAHYGWSKKDGDVGVLGLKGSYHGDTIGVMNSSEPSAFNEKVDWYRPWGFWFDPPQLKMRKGMWELEVPEDVRSDIASSQDRRMNGADSRFKDLGEVFDFAGRGDQAAAYENLIRSTLRRLVREEGRRFGALLLEPVIMGAGGMIFVDPLFHRTLIKVVRDSAEIFALATASDKSIQTQTESRSGDWTGLPVIADEVFTGLYRLGRPSASSFLSTDPALGKLDLEIAPDISVHAKLLTGGLLPLAITTASEAIFNAFLSDKKQDALLHGHSYTAHAVGCAVANESLHGLKSLEAQGAWDEYKSSWQSPTSMRTTKGAPAQTQTANHSSKRFTHHSPYGFWSFWSKKTVNRLSYSDKVDGVIALGTVFAVTLRSEGVGGYASNAAADLQQALLPPLDNDDGDVAGNGTAAGVHSRVLGNVLYLMASLTSQKDDLRKIERRLCKLLC